MASRILNPALFHLRAPLFAASLGISTALVVPQLLRLRRPILLDSTLASASPRDWSYTQYQNDARAPLAKSGESRLNARAIRQLSAGSIAGLAVGLAISAFSKPLVLLLGVLIVGVQTAESYGIHLIPYKRLQGYVTSVDLRSAVQDNVALKLSFGAMFMLTAFAEF